MLHNTEPQQRRSPQVYPTSQLPGATYLYDIARWPSEAPAISTGGAQDARDPGASPDSPAATGDRDKPLTKMPAVLGVETQPHGKVFIEHNASVILPERQAAIDAA